MKRFVKLLAGLLAIAVLGIGLLFLTAWLKADSAAGMTHAIKDPPLTIPTDSNAIAHGAHLFEIRGCGDCHGGDGAGKEVFDAGPVARVVSANITPARLKAAGYDADRIAAAIRHGVRPDGTPLFFMPTGDWHNLGDADTAALIAYLQTLPDQANDPGKSELRPLGKVLTLLGKFNAYPANGLDHSPRERAVPEATVSIEFGRYLADSCTGCHGANLAGGLVLAPGTPMTANLTPKAIGHWTEADFVKAIREGKRPDGTAIDPFMPWQTFGKMSMIELRALWAYMKQVPSAG